MTCPRHGDELIPCEMPGVRICPRPGCEVARRAVPTGENAQNGPKSTVLGQYALPGVVRAVMQSEKPPQSVSVKSELEATFALQMRAAGIPEPLHDTFQFVPQRRFRADFAWPALNLIVEIDGGSMGVPCPKCRKLTEPDPSCRVCRGTGKHAGRHQSITGFRADCEKANEANLAGYLCLKFTGQDVNDGTALRYVERAIALLTNC